MKFYVFFIDATFNQCLEFPIDTPFAAYNNPKEYLTNGFEPYAITKSKKYAEIFRKCRDMRYFVEKEVYVDEQDLESFTNELGDCIIGKHPLTCMYQDKTHLKNGSIILPIPEFEYEIIVSSSVEIFESILMECEYYLTEEFRKLYDEAVALFRPPVRELFNKTSFFEKTEIGLYPEGYYGWEYYLKFNQLVLYSKAYGNTYNEGGLKKLCEYGDFI